MGCGASHENAAVVAAPKQVDTSGSCEGNDPMLLGRTNNIDDGFGGIGSEEKMLSSTIATTSQIHMNDVASLSNSVSDNTNMNPSQSSAASNRSGPPSELDQSCSSPRKDAIESFQAVNEAVKLSIADDLPRRLYERRASNGSLDSFKGRDDNEDNKTLQEKEGGGRRCSCGESDKHQLEIKLYVQHRREIRHSEPVIEKEAPKLMLPGRFSKQRPAEC